MKDLISRIVWGNVDAWREVWDFACADVLVEIKSQFTEPTRPNFFDLSARDAFGVEVWK